MYKIEYLPIARKDLVDIVCYINQELKNPDAAETFAEAVVDAIEDMSEFPYAYATYNPIRALKHEYRKIIVKNYLIFYWIDETKKSVTVARVIYAGRDYEKLL